MNAEKYPLDFDELKKGDVITRVEIDSIIDAEKGTEKYAFELMSFISEINRELRLRGKDCVVCQVKGEIHILTDEEASRYTTRKFELSLAKAFKAHFQKLQIDRTKLNDLQQKDHDRQVINQGRILTVIKEEKNRILLEPHKNKFLKKKDENNQ